MKYLIKNASVVNEGKVFVADVLTDGKLISRIYRETESSRGRMREEDGNALVIDASGKYLIPGIIDEHVHFREPGLTHKADMSSESRAAVAGGVTSFMDMPNTVPPTVTNALLEEKFSLAAQKSLANYSFYLGASNDNLKEVLEADTSRVCGIKLFMGSSTGNMLVDDSGAIEALFREAPCLIAAHCEDESIIRANTGRFKAAAASGKLTLGPSVHPLIRTSQACLTATERAINLAGKTGAHLHILHVSTADELALLQDALPLSEKNITAETCPHYLYFEEKDYSEMGFAIKCNPAIKSSQDRLALLQALKSGKIDTVGTDHAPHLWEEKNTGDYFTSKSGFPSIQHSFEIMYGLCRDGWTDLPGMVRLMCHNPAELYRIDRRGFIREGYHADLAIVDPDFEGLILNSGEFGKCGWSPYDGQRAHARVTHTFVNGNLVYENGCIHDGYRGESLSFNR